MGGGNRKIGENILVPVASVVANAAQQIKSPEDKFIFPSIQEPAFVRSYATDFCPGDPNAPVEEKKETPKKSNDPVKINCDSPVWKNKPRCKK